MLRGEILSLFERIYSLRKFFSIVNGIDRNKIQLWCYLVGIGP